MVMALGSLNFVGRTAIVTGAGGGLGREYALLLAERGASVVVNDLGGSRDGEGKNSSAADHVVREITAKGGKAVADYNSVEDGEKIVKTAIDNFKRIDILINNAGILRDKSFANLSQNDWDMIYRVHLRGAFSVTKAAWPYFRKQGFGRIIMTSSGAGLFGNFGQSNYSSAKLGLLGFSNTLAIEGAKYNIHCNTIIPLAGSRLTEDIFPKEIFDQLSPKYISPLVVYLCHESCTDTGGIFEAAGGWLGKYKFHRSFGKCFIPPDILTPELVRDYWDEITDMSKTLAPANVQEHAALLVDALSGRLEPPPEKTSKISLDPREYTYEHNSAILYALGVGMSTLEPNHINFLFEGAEDFRVLPTFGTIPGLSAVFASPALNEQMQKLNADPSKSLHGEQYLELYEPLPPSGTLSSDVKVVEVLDKGSGAVVVAESDTYNEAGKKIMFSQWTIFLVGAGNFGGARTGSNSKPVLPPPNRAPDAVITEKISPDQAALYRLSGDKNPMHIDPDFAAMGGFSQPILHGLCSLGYATRHVLKQFTDYEVKNFKSVKVRFANPIFPGHTLKTEMWQEGNRVYFQSKALETGKLILSGAYIDFYGSLNTPKKSSGNIFSGSGIQHSPATISSPVENITNAALKSDVVFSFMKKRLEEMPDLASKIQAVYEWQILKDGKPSATWTADLKTGNGRIVRGTLTDLKPGCTLIIEDQDLEDMVTGKLDPQRAFMGGKLKLKGNIMLTQKLRPLLSMRQDSTKARKPAPPAASVSEPAVTQAVSVPKLKCDYVFSKLSQKLEKDPELANSVQTVFQWNVLKNGKQVAVWTLDLKNGVGSVYSGVPRDEKPECTFIMEDDLLSDMMEGKADPQKAFMSGKLKITGNVLASQKLHGLWEPTKNEYDSAPFSAEPVNYPKKEDSPTPIQKIETLPTTKSDFVFEIFAERIIEEPELAKKMKVVYNWNILRGGKKVSEWTVDLKTGSGSIYKGSPKVGKADVTLTMDDEDVIKLMLGKLNPQRAFMTGRLKIKGNIMLTQKLNQLWQEILKSGRAVELPILSPILSDKPFDVSLRSEPGFVELGKRISRMPELVSAIQTVFEWNVTKGGQPRSKWILNLKTDKGMLHRAPAKNDKPTCSLTIEDDDFADWILGKLPAKQILSAGKLKISGDSTKVIKLMESFKPQSKL